MKFQIEKNYTKASESVGAGDFKKAASHFALANSQVQLAATSVRTHTQIQIEGNTPPSTPGSSQGLSDEDNPITRKMNVDEYNEYVDHSDPDFEKQMNRFLRISSHKDLPHYEAGSPHHQLKYYSMLLSATEKVKNFIEPIYQNNLIEVNRIKAELDIIKKSAQSNSSDSLMEKNIEMDVSPSTSILRSERLFNRSAKNKKQKVEASTQSESSDIKIDIPSSALTPIKSKK